MKVIVLDIVLLAALTLVDVELFALIADIMRVIRGSYIVAKYSFSYDESRVTIVDEKSQKVDDKLELLDHVSLGEAFRVLTKGRQADAKASDVAISMLADVLENNSVLQEYKGKTEVDQKVPSTFLSAFRDAENALMKPVFIEAHTRKGASAGKADQLWQEFRKSELTTGSYSNAKSFVAKLFCHVGMTPVAPNGKLLPLYAVRRMYESWKQEQDTPKSAKGIADKLVALSADLHNVGADIGDCPTAIAALKAMLATYETMWKLECERKTEQLSGATSQDVSKLAEAAMQVAKGSRKRAAKPVKESISEETPLTGDALMQALKEAEAALI